MMRLHRTNPLRMLLFLLLLSAPSSIRMFADEPDGPQPRAHSDDPQPRAHYSADQPADFQHMVLRMRFTPQSIRERKCVGRVVHTLRPRASKLGTVTLEAVDMTILSVDVNEQPSQNFSYDDRQLVVHLETPITRDQTLRIGVDFQIEKPTKGMYFVLPSNSAPNKPTMVYTMSEPLEARHWVPCHDWPNEWWTSDIEVTVPHEHTVVSNGQLVNTQPAEDSEGLVRYRWSNDVPTDPHLMGFIFGRLVKLEGDWHGKPLHVFTQPGREAAARHTFRRVGRMLDFYTELTGVQFPFPSYTHVTVVDHHHGGMEHAGYSLIRPIFLSEGDDGIRSPEFVEHNYVAHMLAHQWFGGITNYRSVSEAWLNEGFATYLDHLWLGQAFGQEAFVKEMWQDAQRMARFDSSTTGIPMVNRHFEHAEDIYSADAGKIYYKGAWVIHMLQHRLGKELFWRTVAAYLRDHRGRSVETADLRQALEEASGIDLERFFQQWVYGRGIPQLKVTYRWDAADHEVTVKIEQLQHTDSQTPPFNLPIDLLFRVDDRDVERTVRISDTAHEFTFALSAQPTLFVVDPGYKILKTLAVEVPRALRRQQLVSGPSIVSKLEAINALSQESTSIDLFATVLADQDQPRVVQESAARALGGMRHDEALAKLIETYDSEPGHPDVRDELLLAMSQYPMSVKAHRILLEAAAGTSDVRVEATALRGLGQMRSSANLIAKSLTRLRTAARSSPRPRSRQAALMAIQQLGDSRAYETVFDLAQPAQGDPLRENAIRVLGSLGRGTPFSDQTLSLLTRWLYDTDPAARRAAISGLVLLRDARAIDDLQKLAGSAQSEALRAAASDAIQSIRSAKPDTDSTVPALRQQILTLERRQRQLEKTLDDLKRQMQQTKTSVPAN